MNTVDFVTLSYNKPVDFFSLLINLPGKNIPTDLFGQLHSTWSSEYNI